MTAFRDQSALVERRDRLLEENAALREEVARLEASLAKAREANESPENRDAFVARMQEEYEELRRAEGELRDLLRGCERETEKVAAEDYYAANAIRFDRRMRRLRLGK